MCADDPICCFEGATALAPFVFSNFLKFSSLPGNSEAAQQQCGKNLVFFSFLVLMICELMLLCPKVADCKKCFILEENSHWRLERTCCVCFLGSSRNVAAYLMSVAFSGSLTIILLFYYDNNYLVSVHRLY